jgi:hypothetical protein
MGFSFSDHIGLLEQFLAGRQQIVNDIDRRLLNVRGKAIDQEADRRLFDDILTDCFFESPAVSPERSRLKGQLAAAHLAEGFDPVPADNHSREIGSRGARALRAACLGSGSMAGTKRPHRICAVRLRRIRSSPTRALEREDLG